MNMLHILRVFMYENVLFNQNSISQNYKHIYNRIALITSKH